MTKPLTIIGRAEEVSFPGLGIGTVHARIDTGAQTSSIWASKTRTESGRLGVVFFGESHKAYTGEEIWFDDFTTTVVASSNGQTEIRYKIRATMKIAGRRIRARLTLADRSTQVYPVLVGRSALRGKFVVDVSSGSPLKAKEKARSAKLQSRIKKD